MTTRKDLFLKKLSDSTVQTPTPVTQEEQTLAELAGTGGLGIELPSVSATDNGKALIVSGGKWTASTIPAQIPAFTADDNGKVLMVVDGALAFVTPSGGTE